MGSTHTTGGPGKLRVYHLAIELRNELNRILTSVHCSASLADQLRRCADSIVLNIAEGAGHSRPGKKVYHYQIAHAESWECIAALNLLQHSNPGINLKYAYQTATMVGRMLKSLIIKWEAER
jgi:four helix bundle protein